MPVDFSEFQEDLSGSKNMKKFVEILERRLSNKLKIPIIIKPEGIPYQLNLMVWEIASKEDSVNIDLKMYPAGFKFRYENDVEPHINTIVETLQKQIVNNLVGK